MMYLIDVLRGSQNERILRLGHDKIEMYGAGDFPFDRLVRFYEFDEINQAVADTRSGITVKPILRVSAV